MAKTEVSQGFWVPTGHWIQNAMEAPGLSGYSLNKRTMRICGLVHPPSVGSCCYNRAIHEVDQGNSATSWRVFKMLTLASIPLMSG